MVNQYNLYSIKNKKNLWKQNEALKFNNQNIK